ncbi:succinate dehydrogenase [Lysobacter concretionis Ko07 = DSM 16239]|jgi:succinate dehydrogenase / fumarate reductase membrane anchor subunit|uniref:Succinate dehydrogenase hydrophobic membrane anchor subunit n=1 Tax=Lysobacter concretionis Ko07 = DSM 16239 TaxID=1122185 RepID=A0A0A0ENP1_9GAMM|nr:MULTISPECIES: succinate dehydrogenase, hydrophobic membrane anchor protein [Lysobacter]KGM52034.1 succinate dehydrogenase [Lysobacter concretionis Ko07 = DSM 16239]QOD90230.1 succinate dehydrogenase, hydrophobic membrane anchor protein [Lysobacter sp. CW239]
MSSNNQPQGYLRNPLKRARGLGSAKDGTHHFIIQRITAVALVFLSIYVVFLLLSLVGSDYASVRASVAAPFNAVLLIAFLIASFWHAKLGMQVVIEDYVHTPWLAVTSQLAVIFICVLAALASVFAVIRIALGG